MSSSDGSSLSDSSVEFHTFMQQWRDGRGERRRQPGREGSCAVIGCRACPSPPVSSGSCAVRAVRRSSPNGHHLPLNNVRAIRVLHGSKSHPDSQTQPAGLILTSTGTSRVFCSTPAKNDQIRHATVTLFVALFSSVRGKMRPDANPHEGAGIIYELSSEEARFTVPTGTGAALRPPGTRSCKLICALSHFRRADQVQTCSGGILQHIRPHKAPLCISLSPKSATFMSSVCVYL